MRRGRAVSRVRPRAIAGAPAREPWLPPLNALHAFEAAGRHASFKNAAAELCVTPSAISRQIKLLEDQVGVPLFVRGAALALTGAGARYVRSPGEAAAAGTAESAISNVTWMRVMPAACAAHCAPANDNSAARVA